jgi:hypothetical protein
MGGFNAPFPALEITKFYEYDVIKNSWEELPELPERIFFHKAFAHQDSLIYILGGMKTASRDVPRRSVDLYNIIRRTFQEATQLDEPVAEFSVAKINNDFIIAGGIVEGRELTVTDRVVKGEINSSNPKLINYVQKADYPNAIRSLYSYYVTNILVLFLAGLPTLGLSPVHSAFYYDFLQNLYTAAANTPYPAGAFHAGHNKRSINRGETEVITLVMAGGVTTGPTITGQTWVYRDTIFTTGINDEENSVSEFSLSQNYPNPFNPVTTISFSISSESFISLEVYNVMGEKVSNLVSDNLPAGAHEYEWNASGLPSGVYFYRLTAENFKQTKKLLLMK